MPYNKYQNWPLPSQSGNVFPVLQRYNLEEQVLKDLGDAKDEIDKLEILDSYAAYAQRAYQQEYVQYLSQWIGQTLSTILEPNILSRLPEIRLPHRGRPAEARK